eukprot:13234305-Alexandrium_andersonii.AAC.1
MLVIRAEPTISFKIRPMTPALNTPPTPYCDAAARAWPASGQASRNASGSNGSRSPLTTKSPSCNAQLSRANCSALAE